MHQKWRELINSSKWIKERFTEEVTFAWSYEKLFTGEVRKIFHDAGTSEADERRLGTVRRTGKC